MVDMARQSAAKRLRWFERGAQAVAGSIPVLANLPPCYICPLCFPDDRVFFRGAVEGSDLTLEHAPPKSLDGRELALTCQDCNKRAGSTLDHEMQTLEQYLDFSLGTLSQPARVRFTIGDQILHADMEAEGNNVLIKGVPAANRPNIAQLLHSEVEGLVSTNSWEGATLNIGFTRRLRHQAALVGWLRAAYLVAFAYFGYHYVLDARLRLVRLQIADPHVAHIRIFSTTVPDAHPKARRMLLVREPAEYQSVMVQMDRHVVLLPSPEDSRELYPRLVTIMKPGQMQEVKITGKDLTWPTEPRYIMDLP
jgi:hypothetical protein